MRLAYICSLLSERDIERERERERERENRPVRFSTTKKCLETTKMIRIQISSGSMKREREREREREKMEAVRVGVQVRQCGFLGQSIPQN